VSDKPETQERLPVSEERICVHKRKVETGRVRIRTVPEEREQRIQETVASEEVFVETVRVGREVETMPEVRQEGDTWVFPVVEKVLVVEKRSILKEEARVRRVRRSETVEQPVTLRSTRVIVERGEHTGNQIPESQVKETTTANRVAEEQLRIGKREIDRSGSERRADRAAADAAEALRPAGKGGR
jgi:stress response protein YsnF